jgi:predicted nucleotidyltransferase
MQKRSLSFVVERYRGSQVRVFALDRDALLHALRKRARELIENNPDIVAVWLVGSLARDEAKPGSDADIVVFMRSSSVPFLQRIPEFSRCFSGLGVACEVRAYTLEEWERLRADGAGVVRALEREGVVLASGESELPDRTPATTT